MNSSGRRPHRADARFEGRIALQERATGVGAVPPPRRLRRGGTRGQATVEFALVLPVMLLLVMVLVQVALVVRSQLLVEQAAQAGARAAAVEPTAAAARDAAERSVRAALGVDEWFAVEVAVDFEPGSPRLVRVRVRAKVPATLPVVGWAADDLTTAATAVMAVEAP